MKNIFALIGIVFITALIIISIDLLIFTINDINEKDEEDDWLYFSLIVNTLIAIIATSIIIAQNIKLF